MLTFKALGYVTVRFRFLPNKISDMAPLTGASHTGNILFTII